MPYIKWFDYSIIHFLNQFAAKSHTFDILVYDIANSSLLKGGLFMAYFWWLWFKTDSDILSRRRAIIVSLAGASVIVLIARLLQIGLPYHQRPALTADLGFVVPFGVNPRTLNAWSSFPSDHATLFFALSTAVWYQSRILGLAAMAWTLIVISLTRAYIGFHYPSDVIGGAILGIVLMAAAHRVLRNARWTKVLVHWEAEHRALFYCGAFVFTYEIAVLFDDFRSLGLDAYYVLKSIKIAVTGN